MRLTFEEYRCTCRLWEEREEHLERSRWERMRLSAAITVQPWVKKKVTAKELLSLPWDDKTHPDPPEGKVLNKEESKRRFLDLLKRRKLIKN